MTESTTPEPAAGTRPPWEASTAARTYEQALGDAVQVMTEAARLTRSRTDGDGRPTSPMDWAEFVTLALAGAAANIGGIEAVLAGRPGSWEADYVRNLLTSTVGHDGAQLLEHRTEPVVVDLYIDDIMADLRVWAAYDEANQQLIRRYDAIGIPSVTAVPGDADYEAAQAALPAATEGQERQADAIADLEERLEQLRERDWAEYGQTLKANVEAAAQRREGLRVPAVVTVDLDTFRSPDEAEGTDWDIAEQLRTEAIEATPLPGDGRPPLERLRP